jgi:hypothetical protein
MAYPTYTILFTPAMHLTGSESTVLAGYFRDQGVAPPFKLRVLRRRGAWAATLPIGIYQNDFRPDVTTREAHLTCWNEVLAQAVKDDAFKRMPVRNHQKVLDRDGELFYHLETLRFLRSRLDPPYFVDALYRFLLDATKNLALIVPKVSRASFIPPEKRKEHFGLKGSSCRGPAWTSDEDAVLRRWFGQRTTGPAAGQHETLSEEQWQRVLEVELKGRRTKASVRGRFVQLNDELLKEFLLDGYVPLHRVREYMTRAIGERPRRPPIRERKARKRRVSTDATL